MQPPNAIDELDVIGAARFSDDFRRVLVTGAHMQVVVMTIPPGGEIGAETHPEVAVAQRRDDGFVHTPDAGVAFERRQP